jgi:hypothetical protein
MDQTISPKRLDSQLSITLMPIEPTPVQTAVRKLEPAIEEDGLPMMIIKTG